MSVSHLIGFLAIGRELFSKIGRPPWLTSAIAALFALGVTLAVLGAQMVEGAEPSSVKVLKDIKSGPSASNPGNLTVVNGTLFFAANDGPNGAELWKSDGTPDGTVLVKDIRPGFSDSSPAGLTDVGGTLYFGANDGSNGTELWKSDGTATGTVMVKDIRGRLEGFVP